MILFLLLSVLGAPSMVEVQQGPSLEVLYGANFKDKQDHTSMDTGIRFTWIRADLTDSFITADLQWTTQKILDEKKGGPKNKQLFEGDISFYEIYNPTALRIAFGGGSEYRNDGWSPDGFYRFGLGYYFDSFFSTWLDAQQRFIFRESKMSSPLSVALSAQIIF